MESADPTTLLRIHHAQDALARAGILTGAKEARITARVQAGLLDAARRRSGLQSETDLIVAGLSLLAAPADFGVWLTGVRGTLSDDFAIGL